MNVTSLYFNYYITQKNITSNSNERLLASGKTNIIVLDKTGTLTQDNHEVHGFQTTKKKQFSDSLDFDTIENSSILYNSVYKEFWKKYYTNPNDPFFNDYQDNLQFNIIYFLECLATCHSMSKIKGEFIGHSYDKKVFDKLDWKMESFSIKNNQQISEMKPKNCFKITENFNKTSTLLNKKRFKLSIVKTFEFNAKFLATSVIVKNHFDNSLTFNIKGAPEKIFKICNPNTLPENIYDKLLEYTQSGLRVFACAFKHLPLDTKYDDELNDIKYECDLKFLGFIIFRNKLKKDTKAIISKFNKSGIKLVISTGDNSFTTIGVATECELINKTDPIFICNIQILNKS